MKNKIIPNKEYAIKTNGDYFLKKYGQENPVIRIEDKAEKIFGENWKDTMNWAIIVFVKRISEDLTTGQWEKLIPNSPNEIQVYYGKVDNMGELVFEDELYSL